MQNRSSAEPALVSTRLPRLPRRRPKSAPGSPFRLGSGQIRQKTSSDHRSAFLRVQIGLDADGLLVLAEFRHSLVLGFFSPRFDGGLFACCVCAFLRHGLGRRSRDGSLESLPPAWRCQLDIHSIHASSLSLADGVHALDPQHRRHRSANLRRPRSTRNARDS